MRIWTPRPASKLPRIPLARWRIFQTGDGSRHFVGLDMFASSGHVSSPIATFGQVKLDVSPKWLARKACHWTLTTSGYSGANCTRSRRTPTSPNVCLMELMMTTPHERIKATTDFYACHRGSAKKQVHISSASGGEAEPSPPWQVCPGYAFTQLSPPCFGVEPASPDRHLASRLYLRQRVELLTASPQCSISPMPWRSVPRQHGRQERHHRSPSMDGAALNPAAVCAAESVYVLAFEYRHRR